MAGEAEREVELSGGGSRRRLPETESASGTRRGVWVCGQEERGGRHGAGRWPTRRRPCGEHFGQRTVHDFFYYFPLFLLDEENKTILSLILYPQNNVIVGVILVNLFKVESNVLVKLLQKIYIGKVINIFEKTK
jgi:hypothetical protein